VQVLDVAPPRITQCAPNVTLATGSHPQNITVGYLDNLDLPSQLKVGCPFTRNYSHRSLDGNVIQVEVVPRMQSYPVGVTQVNFTVTDSSNNTAWCTYFITVGQSLP
jgi:hypothetical protein